MNKIKIEIIKDLATAEMLWNTFTPRETIYDEWEFRYCFYKYFNYELFFYTAYEEGKPVGLLPLEYNSDQNYLEYFGGNFMEDNRVLVKPGYEYLIPDFFNAPKQKMVFLDIRGNDPFIQKLEIRDNKFVLDLSKVGSVENYLQNYFGSETRKTFRKCFKKITDRKLNILINNFEDIELLFEYNIRQFGDKSRFVDRPHRKEIFRDLLNLSFEPVLFTFEVDGVKEGVSLCLKYKKVYESFNTGIRNDSIKHLFAFMIMKNIDYALQNGMLYYDAFGADCNWKEKWGFTKIPQYKFENNL